MAYHPVVLLEWVPAYCRLQVIIEIMILCCASLFYNFDESLKWHSDHYNMLQMDL